MKNILLVLTFVLPLFLNAQLNPPQNVEWGQNHDDSSYDNSFSLLWDEPEQPHDDLIGYNIYQEDNLYKFVTNTDGLYCNPQFGGFEDCDFIEYNDGNPFIGYISAIYGNDRESEKIPFGPVGPLLSSNDAQNSKFSIYPNPANDTLYFSENLNQIKIYDLTGNLIVHLENSISKINISALAGGVYILKAKTSSGKEFEQKFIKN